jgi:hypothetical protein
MSYSKIAQESSDISCSASQEIPRILWNSEVYHRLYWNPQLVPTPRQMKPNHCLCSCFEQYPFKYYLSIYGWVFQVTIFP